MVFKSARANSLMPWSNPVHSLQATKQTKQQRLNAQKLYNKEKRTGQHFYKTTAWRKLRAWHAKANPLCEDCKKEGRATQVQIVDHVIEIKDGGEPLNPKNLRSLCRMHHNKKTKIK